MTIEVITFGDFDIKAARTSILKKNKRMFKNLELR
ncbi:MAG: hypothetical protein PWQ97_304 [Tepidanaerobacteraceae bacterium]|nr:hypothetical protein [Tepidanaerobacteraceae bacterium]